VRSDLFGITVNTLSPGLTMSENVRLHHPTEQIDRMRVAGVGA
jgi:hypothetical protein